MISFGITPFTDLPAHRIIRYFTRESSTEEEQAAVHSELSHLWSERRRREEDRFATLLADLVAIAKELDVVVSGTSTSSTCDVPFMSGAHNSTQTDATNEDECIDVNRMETQDAVWLNDMKAKVQTLLQDAHNVLGTPQLLAESTTSESLFNFSSDKHNDDSDSDGICHSLSLDVISLYMGDHSNSNSFTFEGPTLLEGDPDSGMVTSKSDAHWLLGDDGDTSTDTTHASFSLDQYLEIEINLNLKDRGFGEKAIIPDSDSSRNIANAPSLFSITSSTPIA